MTQRDWQKDMDVVQALKGNKVADAMCYWLQETKERGEREQRLKEALETIKEISERDGVSFYLDRCYIEARDVLDTLYPDTPAPKEEYDQ